MRTYFFFMTCNKLPLSEIRAILSDVKYLGVDYGDRRVGIAASDSGLIAEGVTVLTVSSMRQAIEKTADIAAARAVDVIVVGLPLNMDGTEGARADKTRAFGRVLGRVTGKPVEYCDERLTSVEADELMTAAGVKRTRREAIIDKAAAKLILQSYLDRNNRVKKE